MASQWHLQLLPQQRHLHLRHLRLPQVQLQGAAQEVPDLQGDERVNKTEVHQRRYWILHGFHMDFTWFYMVFTGFYLVLDGFYMVLFGSMVFERILFSRKLSL